jgi:hypothetical protein
MERRTCQFEKKKSKGFSCDTTAMQMRLLVIFKVAYPLLCPALVD